MFFCEYLKMSNEEETGGTEDIKTNTQAPTAVDVTT